MTIRRNQTTKFKNRARGFARDEDGALLIFGVLIFGLMLAAAGLSFDLMRYEAHRGRLQATLDRAVLSAAALSQTMDAEDVVEEYFATAGMSDYLDNVTVTQGISSKTVEASASITVPLHHGDLLFGGGQATNLIAEGYSVAQEAIGNVEISLVLDVSGSMNWYNRLTDLKSAAQGFMDTVYDASDPDKVSTSIIPYATQVNAGSVLLSHYNRDNSHEHSHCINFESGDFNSASLSTTQQLEQTLHFDPWTDKDEAARAALAHLAGVEH